MTEALSLCADYLFQSTKIHRVQLIIAEGNIASERVAQKCGFTYEGTARQAMFQRGRHQDMKLYALLRNEVDTCLPAASSPQVPHQAGNVLPHQLFVHNGRSPPAIRSAGVMR